MIGYVVNTEHENLVIEIRKETVLLSDNYQPSLNDIKQAIGLYPLNEYGTTAGSVEVTKEWLGYLLDFWTTEKRKKYGV